MKFIDMHCDTLMTAFLKKLPTLTTMPDAMVDIDRMRKSGALAQFFAMFLLPVGSFERMGIEPIDDDVYLDALTKVFNDTIAANSDVLARATNANEMLANEKAGKMSAFLTIEDGRSVNGDMNKLKKYYDMGVRLISLTWNFDNCFGAPNSYEPEVMNKGLTAFGKEAIPVMNDMGIIIDVSHLSDGGFMDVARLSKKPFVASHSNCRALSPHKRNMNDAMIKIMGEKGGVAGINFGPEFLNEDVTGKVSSVELMSKHVKHFINIGGTECVGLGSDFDGVHGEMEIGSIDKMHLLFDRLKKEVLSEEQIEKVAYKNATRVILEAMK